MFCPKCSSLLMPNNGKMACGNCNYTQTEGKVTEKKKKANDIAVVENKEPQVLPITKYDCKKCGYPEAYFWTVQTRSADEPETKFYKCAKCNTVNREY